METADPMEGGSDWGQAVTCYMDPPPVLTQPSRRGAQTSHSVPPRALPRHQSRQLWRGPIQGGQADSC